MTREDIIRIAREAGLERNGYWEFDMNRLARFAARFAALVAASEREACAKVCERYWSAASLESDRTATAIAAAIRSRGEIKEAHYE